MRAGGIDIRLKVGGGCWGRVRVKRRWRSCGRRTRNEGFDFDFGGFVLGLCIIVLFCGLWIVWKKGHWVFDRVDEYIYAIIILFLVEYYCLP